MQTSESLLGWQCKDEQRCLSRGLHVEVCDSSMQGVLEYVTTNSTSNAAKTLFKMMLLLSIAAGHVPFVKKKDDARRCAAVLALMLAIYCAVSNVMSLCSFGSKM